MNINNQRYIAMKQYSYLYCILIIHCYVISKEEKCLLNNRIPVLCFDLDKTIIDSYSVWKRNTLIFGKAFPFKLDCLWSLYKEQAKDKYGTFRFKLTVNGKVELAPSGAGLSLACYGVHGTKGNCLQSIMPTILDIHCEYTDFVPGAAILLDYLVHTKKYNVVYATNKDYLTYIITQEKIDKKHHNLFGKAPAFVLLAHPTKNFLDTILVINKSMPIPFQHMLQQIKNAQQGHNIFFAPEKQKKPEDLYYELLKKKIKQELPNHGSILFFDDKKYNIDAAKRNGILASYHVRLENQVIDIIKALEVEQLLCPKQDAALYKALAYLF